MAPLVNMRGLEKGRQQKKQTKPHETARLHSSFLFALTTEGALYRILLQAHFSGRTHTPTPTHCTSPLMSKENPSGIRICIASTNKLLVFRCFFQILRITDYSASVRVVVAN